MVAWPIRRLMMTIDATGHTGAPAAERPDAEDARLKQACRDFEAIFVAYMLKKMQDAVPKTDLMGSSEKEEVFRGMLNDEIAKEVAQTGSMKLGDHLYSELSKRIPKGR